MCSSGSSLSGLSSSTVTDVVAKLRRTPMSDAQGLRIGRWAPIGWGLAFIATATIFRSDEGSIVVLALGVAGMTYGGLLGAFLFGIVNKRARAADANIAFVIAVAVNAFFFVIMRGTRRRAGVDQCRTTNQQHTGGRAVRPGRRTFSLT